MSLAVIFDLDGTLTLPYLDFDAIRAEIGLPSGPILESLERLDAASRARAEQILHRHEAIAAENSRLRDGAGDTLARLRERGVAVGILTRNSRRSIEQVLRKHGIAVDATWCRDDGAIKPAPEPVFRLCEKLGVPPERTWVVGDHLFDMLAGGRAGAQTVFMLGDRDRSDCPEQADHAIRHLEEIVALVGAAAASDLADPC
jgi:HAD superfamily hydrolase (TIGR01509 family)